MFCFECVVQRHHTDIWGTSQRPVSLWLGEVLGGLGGGQIMQITSVMSETARCSIAERVASAESHF